MKLEAINSTRLTLLESGQFINQTLTDIATLDIPEGFTDAVFTNFLQDLHTKQEELSNAIMVVRKNDETIKISKQDKVRDQALNALKKANAVHLLSENIEIQDAAKSLKTLFSTYKNLSVLNYGAETHGIDHLLGNLGNSKYEPLVEMLDITQYVSRLQASNDNFKVLFDGRSQENAQQEKFNTKAIKKEMLGIYNDLAQYVLTMAKVKTDILYYTELLNVLNYSRKYFSIILARRKGVASEAV